MGNKSSAVRAFPTASPFEMSELSFHPDLLQSASNKTVVITGAARGIGAATASLFNQHGANVVITDLPPLRDDADTLIESLHYPDKALFVPASVTDWKALTNVFKEAIRKFGRVDVVVANAGIMETSAVLDVAVDEAGEPVESKEANRVLDVNLKGTLNSECRPRPPMSPCKTDRLTISSGPTGFALHEPECPVS